MVTPAILKRFFDKAEPFAVYLSHAKPHERPGWDGLVARAKLSAEQRAVIATFSRTMYVLCISGTWCGDCVQQVPILLRIAEAKPLTNGAGIDLRFLEREANLELADMVQICGGRRVPTVIFMNEDHEFVSLLGDRTLARYRAIAASSLGPACPMPGAPLPDDQMAATTQDWVNEFERVALLLRLSAKLRERHGD